MTADQFAGRVDSVLSELGELLRHKNRMYGDAALRPLGIFGSADPEDGIRNSLDGKLKRIQTSEPDDQEDAIMDLTGYLILLMIARSDKAMRDAVTPGSAQAFVAGMRGTP